MQVLAAITIGIALGHFYPEIGASLKPLGDAFIKLVKMVIAPVIFLTVATGIAGMSDLQKVGRVAGKAMLYFLTFSTLALIIGLVVGNVVQPGAGFNIDPATLDAEAVSDYAAKAHEQSIVGFLSNIIPTTIVGAFADGDILQVLFFSVLFGIALAMVGEKGAPVLDFLQAADDADLQAGQHPDAGRADRRIRRDGLHHRQVRHRLGRQPRHAGRHLLPHRVPVRVRRSGRGLPLNGFSILALIRYIKDELLLVLGTSSSEAALALADGEDGKGRLRSARWSGWSFRPATPSTSTAPTST